MIGLEFFLRFFAEGHDLAHVALVEGGEGGGGLLRHDHLRGDLAPERRHFLAREALFARSLGRFGSDGLFRSAGLFLVVGGGGFRLRFEMSEDVPLRQAAAFAGGADGGGVELFLGRQAFDRRRKNLGVRGTFGGGFRRRGLGVVRGGGGWLRFFFGRGARLVVDRRHDFADFHFLALVDFCLENTGLLGRDLGRNLVGLKGEERFARLDVFARLLVPDGDDTALDRFTDRRDFYFDAHESPNLSRTLSCGRKISCRRWAGHVDASLCEARG